MKMIPSFEEYINERLFKQSIDRIESGKKRHEDLTPLDNICKFAGEFIAKKLKIEYKPELCIYYEDEEYNKRNEDLIAYCISMDFSELGSEFSDIDFDVYLSKLDGNIDNPERVYYNFAGDLDEFQDQMDYSYYEDPYIPNKRGFNRIKKILEKLVNEIYKKMNRI